jgi:sugar lactone lactonase YvrE
MKKLILIFCLLLLVQVVNSQCVSTLAGSGVAGYLDGTGTAASFNIPTGNAVDASGNLYVTDSFNNLIRKITPAGVVTTFAGSGEAGFANGTGTASKFNYPCAIAVDSGGNLYVADTYNNRIRKITSSGVVTTFAGSGISGYANGVGTAAQFNNPWGIAVDASGNVFVGDTNNSSIRKITPTGVVTTLAGSGIAGFADGIGTSAQFNFPHGVAVDGSGNVYVADSNNFRIRKINVAAGIVTTLAGSGINGYEDGNGALAKFATPTGVAVDAIGNVYVADTNGSKIRKISVTNLVTTFAGSTTQGYIDGIGLAAQFNFPRGISVDASGNVYITDTGNRRIRKITTISVTLNYDNSPFCKSLTTAQSSTLSGVGNYIGGTYSSTTGLTINTSTGTITPSSSTPGTYTVTYNTPSNGGCQISTTTQVTITAVPTASINYTGSPFCKSLNTAQPVSLTGTGAYTGGTYSSTAGLSINATTGAINPSLSTAGTYTVTYTTPASGGCASVSTTRQITITAPPTASISYSLNGYCNGISNPQPVTITGTGAYLGGSYSAPSGLSINSLTGEVRPSLSTVGTYTVSYTIPASGGCASIQVTTTVTILPLNTVSSAPNQTICINTPLAPITHTTTGATGTGTPTGLPSGVSASFSNNIITISGAPTTAGTFNYSIPLTGGCGTFYATGTITVIGHSPASISADGTISTATTITNGNAIQLQLNGTFNAQPNIQWIPALGISSTTVANPLVYPSSTTTYTASFINSNGCPQSTSITVNVTPQPNIGNLSLNSPNTTPIGLFDTITVNVQLTNATDLYSLYMKLKGNAAVSQYLDYTGYVAGNLLGTSNVISTPPTVTNGVPDFGMTKVGPQPGYNGSGLFYTFTFVPKNVTIPDGTVFCFYLDDVSSYNSSATSCGLTNQGPICFTFTNQVKVWPGDLNKSNMVTTADLLPIGYFYNSTGPVRPNATIQWTGQPATLWGYNRSTMNGSAYKTFADSNGDGVINNADQAAIGFNMNQIHNRQSNNKPFGIAPNSPNNLQTLGNLIVTPNASIIDGATLPQTVTFDVNLSNTGGLNSLFGISVNLIFDNTIFDLSTATINYNGSIFGNVGTDCLVMNYNSDTGVSVGLTRFLNSAINGNGLLFKVTLQTRTTLPSLLQTQVTSYVDSANNQIGEPLGISNDTPIDFSIINNNLSLEDTTLNVFNLYPNPTKGLVYFSVGNNMNYRKLELKIFNTLGQLVDSISVKNSLEEIDAKNWGATGLYFVQILDENYNTIDVKKIILQ